MFQRLYELSQLLPSKTRWEMINEGMPENYDLGFAICFDPKGKYVGIRSKNGNSGVVYRPGPSNNSAPLTPCSKLSEKMDSKLAFIFQSAKSVLEQGPLLPADWSSWLQSIPWEDNDFQKTVLTELEEAQKSSGIGEKLESGRIRSGYMFPARFSNNKIEPLFQLDAAKEVMVEKTIAVWSEESKREGCCSICGDGPKQVFGNFSELKCYSLDKPGSIAGGFQRAAASKNFPVCLDCAFSLTATIEYVSRNLIGNMAGESYIILPFSSSLEVRNLLKDELRIRPQRFSISSRADLLIAMENNFIEYLFDKNLDEQLAFSLIFFAEEQKSWRIQAEVHQVLPSRIKEIHAAIQQIFRDPILYSIQKQGKQTSEKPLQITSYTLKEFTGPENKKSGDTLRLWLAAIFSGESIERAPFIHHLVNHLISTGKREPEKLGWITRQAWGLYQFARLVNLISQGRNTMVFEEPKSSFGQYINKHADFFYRPEIATAFLTGCYVSTVCSVQRKERGSDPFSKKFLGRLLKPDNLKKLYREGHDKLSQYRKLKYVATTLDPDLAESWVQCPGKWNVSDEEATFAFTVGYSLAYRIGKEYKIEPAAGTEEDGENLHTEESAE